MTKYRKLYNKCDGRGQSEVIGVVLVVSITIVVITAISASGAAVLGNVQSDSRIAQTENSMAQMSAKAGLVALGGSGAQSFDLGNLGDGRVDVREDAGHVKLFYESDEEETEELYNRSYGAVVATVGGTEIAYQGGGVWKKSDGRSAMVSPPEYHYRSNTLTFPVIRLVGDGRAGGAVSGRFVSANATTPIYPSENHTNPLEEGNVTVEVQSEYYDAWYRFFEERTDGDVEIDDGNRTVSAELTVPNVQEIENAVAVSTPNGITINGGDKPDPHREGVDYPSASSAIDERVETCGDGSCKSIDSGTTRITGESSEEYYYATGEYAPTNLTIEAGEGENIEIVVNGAFEPENISIEGDGKVSVYVTDGFSLSGGDKVNAGGSSEQLFVYVHSDVDEITTRGNPIYTGVLYAPNTNVELSGNTEFTGALIAESLHINGNSHEFEYDESLTGLEIDVGADRAPIRYLHVTENGVEVEFR